MGRLDLALPPGLRAFARYLAAAESTGAELLLVVAHPDDETIGFGGHLPRLRQATIVHLTDGAPADLRDARAHGFTTAGDYAAARRRELQAALAEAGVEPSHWRGFDIPDQTAARQLSRLAADLAAVFTELRPGFVLTHAYEGGHPDHDAAAYAVSTACRSLRRRGLPAPEIVEMAFYSAGPAGPVFQRFAPSGTGAEIELTLAPEAAGTKQRMLNCYATQQQTLAPFSTASERFRSAPAYDFRALPNGGRLLYEAWGLGLTGAEWLRLARAALDELGLDA